MQHDVQLSSHKLDLLQICILATRRDVTKIHLYAIPGYWFIKPSNFTYFQIDTVNYNTKKRIDLYICGDNGHFASI